MMKLFAKKSLGQHFLNSKHVLGQIIAAANIQKGDKVLEIGPGTGVLTRELLNAGAQVIAIEKDSRAFEFLKIQFDKEIRNGQLELILGDILDTDLKSQISNIKSSYSVVANIPYYITGAILEKFLEHGPRPAKMVLLVQKEVAERIVARDGKESILSISVKAFGTPRIVATVPPGAFSPPPTVDSAMLAIENISNLRFDAIQKDSRLNPTLFFKVVRAGFAHKRKLLKRNLEVITAPERIDSAWKALSLRAHSGLNEKARAEDLTVSNWLDLARALMN